MQGFKTLYPYLQEIAHSNGIVDPFDDRVVEAYWVGNALLETIPQQRFYRHLRDTLDLKRKYKTREFDQLIAKLGQGARMHHNVHVLNAYKRIRPRRQAAHPREHGLVPGELGYGSYPRCFIRDCATPALYQHEKKLLLSRP